MKFIYYFYLIFYLELILPDFAISSKPSGNFVGRRLPVPFGSSSSSQSHPTPRSQRKVASYLDLPEVPNNKKRQRVGRLGNNGVPAKVNVEMEVGPPSIFTSRYDKTQLRRPAGSVAAPLGFAGDPLFRTETENNRNPVGNNDGSFTEISSVPNFGGPIDTQNNQGSQFVPASNPQIPMTYAKLPVYQQPPSAMQTYKQQTEDGNNNNNFAGFNIPQQPPRPPPPPPPNFYPPANRPRRSTTYRPPSFGAQFSGFPPAPSVVNNDGDWRSRDTAPSSSYNNWAPDVDIQALYPDRPVTRTTPEPPPQYPSAYDQFGNPNPNFNFGYSEPATTVRPEVFFNNFLNGRVFNGFSPYSTTAFPSVYEQAPLTSTIAAPPVPSFSPLIGADGQVINDQTNGPLAFVASDVSSKPLAFLPQVPLTQQQQQPPQPPPPPRKPPSIYIPTQKPPRPSRRPRPRTTTTTTTTTPTTTQSSERRMQIILPTPKPELKPERSMTPAIPLGAADYWRQINFLIHASKRPNKQLITTSTTTTPSLPPALPLPSGHVYDQSSSSVIKPIGGYYLYPPEVAKPDPPQYKTDVMAQYQYLQPPPPQSPQTPKPQPPKPVEEIQPVLTVVQSPQQQFDDTYNKNNNENNNKADLSSFPGLPPANYFKLPDPTSNSDIREILSRAPLDEDANDDNQLLVVSCNGHSITVEQKQVANVACCGRQAYDTKRMSCRKGRIISKSVGPATLPPRIRPVNGRRPSLSQPVQPVSVDGLTLASQPQSQSFNSRNNFELVGNDRFKAYPAQTNRHHLHHHHHHHHHPHKPPTTKPHRTIRPLPKCGSNMPITYNPKERFCCGETLYERTPGQICCDQATYAVSPDETAACCGRIPYDFGTHFCERPDIVVEKTR